MTTWENFVIETVKATVKAKEKAGDTMSVWKPVTETLKPMKEVNPELEGYELDL